MKHIIILLSLFITSGVIAQSFETSKLNGNPVSNQSFIYALPQTSIAVNIEIIKTTVKKGPYAEYAEKYLKLTDVPQKDTHFFSLAGIKIEPQAEADPAQYYAITSKTFPENLEHLFSISKNGIIIDFSNTWKEVTLSNLHDNASSTITDPLVLERVFNEKVDTTYNTVMKDSIMQRIPVFKKQKEAKSEEEIIEETANQLIKTRRHKIKILRGEYDFHPDGAALRVMVDELNKYEESLLALFAGTRTVEKQHYIYTFVPQMDALNKDLCYFSPQKGLLNEKSSGTSVISIQVTKGMDVNKGIMPEKGKNTLYLRIPLMSEVTVKVDDKYTLTSKAPIYQFGTITTMPLN